MKRSRSTVASARPLSRKVLVFTSYSVAGGYGDLARRGARRRGAAAARAFYSYSYPEPAGFAEASVRPAAARYDPTLREWILPYEAVREAADPDATLLEFLQSVYEAAATLAGWNRGALERQQPLAPPRSAAGA